MIRATGWFLFGLVVLVSVVAEGQLVTDQAAIQYDRTPARDAIQELQKRIDAGKVSLKFDDEGPGYLKSVLDALGISTRSQVLVFSKTSFQHTRIAPRTPRAVYFADDVYIGWCQGGDVVEVSAVDPKLGATFYILDQEKVERPKFQRQTDLCLQCHQSARTLDVPGHMVRSIYPDRRGYPVFSAGGFVTDTTSPFRERWGGWYVTGEHGDQRHMGNAILDDTEHPESLDVESGANLKSLRSRLDTGPYLTDTSDIVALMVLEHQTQVHNLITFAGYEARLTAAYDEGINKALERPAGTVSDSSRSRLKSASENLVKSLLFVGEPKLTAPIVGNSGFSEDFAKRGKRDSRGRSLRDFDLKTRLFKYPCSFLIDSDAIQELPTVMKDKVYTRLREIFDGQDKSETYAHLSPEDRRAIREILDETIPGFSGKK